MHTVKFFRYKTCRRNLPPPTPTEGSAVPQPYRSRTQAQVDNFSKLGKTRHNSAQLGIIRHNSELFGITRHNSEQTGKPTFCSDVYLPSKQQQQKLTTFFNATYAPAPNSLNINTHTAQGKAAVQA